MADIWQGIAGRRIERHRGALRLDVTRDGWLDAMSALSAGRLTLAGLWGDDGAVHMAAYADGEGDTLAVLSLACPDGTFPSIGRLHAPAIRLERAIRDLHGFTPEDCPDSRPWLDHGSW
ncbi:MAG: hydrogenase expression protein HypE, partial [Bauldia sp.]